MLFLHLTRQLRSPAAPASAHDMLNTKGCEHRWLATPLKSDNAGKDEEDEVKEQAAAEEGPSTFISPNKRSRIITPANKACHHVPFQ